MMNLPRPTRVALAAVLACLALPVLAADGPPPSDQAQTLATCHGRYTAAVEHSRLTAIENDAAALRRDYFAALMNTFLAERDGDRPYAIAMMKFRVEARAEMRTLYSTAEFDQDPRRQRMAAAQAMRALAACDSVTIDLRHDGM